MKTDIEANNKLTYIVTALFLRRRKINILLVFISQSYFKVAKTTRLNATHFLSRKYVTKENSNKQHQNHSYDIEFEVLMKLYKDYAKEPFSSLVKNTTLLSTIKQSIKIQEEPIKKLQLVKRSKESITKSSKTKLNIIETEKQQKFQLDRKEMLVKINF